MFVLGRLSGLVKCLWQGQEPILEWRALLRQDLALPTNIKTRVESIDIKRKNRLLMVCYGPTTNNTFLALFLAVDINSTNEANKADSMRC